MKYLAIGILTSVMAAGMSVRTQAEQPDFRRLPSVDESVDAWFVSSTDALLIRGQEQKDMCGLDAKDDCGGKGGSCCAGVGGIGSNTALFFAGDGWNSVTDDDNNNNFGFRAGFNSGLGIGALPIRAQIGASYGGYNFYGRENYDDVNEAGAEQQVFLTGGIYMPSDVCCGRQLSWGVVWDYMHGENYGEDAWNVNLNQIRGRIGYALNEANEIGVWGAFSINETTIVDQDEDSVPFRAMNQASVYWKRNWCYGADTMAYVGGAEEPGQLVLGLRGHAPLSCRVALFGNMHYIVPSTSPGDRDPNGFDDSFAEETWNVTFGIVFYPGGKAASSTVSGHAGLPYLPVADNGTFAVRAPTSEL